MNAEKSTSHIVRLKAETDEKLMTCLGEIKYKNSVCIFYI